jgi:hypothetical protein
MGKVRFVVIGRHYERALCHFLKIYFTYYDPDYIPDQKFKKI